MKQILKLILLLVIGQTALAQAPSNYTNINGRYRWIAGMFDSTFHIPKGTTPSLRTGGSTNGGALFYKTADSSLQLYTGTQWLRMLKVGDTTGMLTPYFNSVGVGLKNTGQTVYADTLLLSTRAWRQKGIDSVVALIPSLSGYVPYTGATQDLDMGTFSVNAKSFHIKGTAGQGHLGLKHQTATPSISANESGVYADVNGDLGLKNDNLYTSIFKTSLNTADRTYTFQNKSYTVGDSADIAARVKYTDTASMLSPYLRSNVAAATYVPLTRTITINGTSQDLSANRTYNVGTVTSVATNTGTGITGGTITTSGTIAADTLLLSTRAWRQKGVDSVASLINTRISGTTNYIPKFTSSSAIGNSILYVDGTTLGVNTSAPYLGASAEFRQQSTYDGIYVSESASSRKAISMYHTGSVGTIDVTYLGGGGSYTPLSFVTGGSERMRLTSGGNLGIGTSSAASKLTTVIATTPTDYSSSAIMIGGSGASSYAIGAIHSLGFIYDPAIYSIPAVSIGHIITDNAGATKGAITFATRDVVTNTAPTERMRLDASGNLGLGISAPTAKLDVSGTARFTGNVTSNVQFISNNGTVETRLSYSSTPAGVVGTISNHALEFYTNSSAKMTLTTSGNLGLGVTPSAWTGGTPRIFQFGPGGALGTNSAQDNAFMGANWYYNVSDKYLGNGFATQYRQNAGAHQWYIAPNNTSGAGASISFTQAMTLDASGRLGIGVIPVGSDGLLNVNIGGSTFHLGYGANYDNYYTSGASGVHIFRTGASERMRITSAGLVGINTSSPSGNFDIFSSSNVYQNISTNGTNQSAVLSLYNSTATGDGAAIGYNVAMRFGTITGLNAAGFTERMRITSGGDIGVSATSVIGSGFGYAGNTGASASAYLQLYNGASGETKLWNTGYYAMIFGNGNSERMRLNSSGELLINTTSDAGDYKLQVNGNVYATGIGYINGGIVGNSSNNLYLSSNSSGGEISFWANQLNTRLMTILGGGDVGIGVSSPSAKLEVNGAIKTAAPSGGTAAAWKLGERVASAGVTFNDQQYIQLDIGGTLYYLATVDLPMPEAYPQATSGPSNNYKMAPVQVKTTRDAEIEKLRKEIEELKQLIKNK